MTYQLSNAQRSAGGKRSGEVRLAQSKVAAVEKQELATLLEWCDRAQLAPSFVAGALKLAVMGAAGAVPEPESPKERLQLIEAAQALHKMARLEMGESTSNTLTGTVDTVDPDVLAQRLANLRRTVVPIQVSDAPTSQPATPPT